MRTRNKYRRGTRGRRELGVKGRGEVGARGRGKCKRREGREGEGRWEKGTGVKGGKRQVRDRGGEEGGPVGRADVVG